MNQRSTSLSVAKALTGFLQYKSAEGLAPVTIAGYEHDLRLWIEHQGDMDVGQVRPQHILSYLSYLRTDYVPRRIAGDNSHKLTPKTIYTVYVCLASFFNWASREFGMDNPIMSIPRPRVPPDPPVEPFRKEELEALIKACDFSTCQAAGDGEAHPGKRGAMCHPAITGGWVSASPRARAGLLRRPLVGD